MLLPLQQLILKLLCLLLQLPSAKPPRLHLQTEGPIMTPNGADVSPLLICQDSSQLHSFLSLIEMLPLQQLLVL